MAAGDIELDAASALFVYGTWSGTANSVFVAVLLEGPCRVDDMVDAATDVVRRDPVWRSRIVEVPTLVGRRLVWRPEAAPAPVEIVDLRSVGGGREPGEWIIDEIYDRGRVPRDPRVHQPLRVVVGPVTDDVSVLAVEVHHAAGDGPRIRELILEVLVGYHRRVAGETPPWVDAGATATAPAGGVAPASRRETLRLLRRSESKYPLRRTTLIDGTPSREVVQFVGRHRESDPDVLDAIADRARQVGGSLTDLIVAASMSAVGEWNRRRGVDVDVQRHAVLVGQRGRASGGGANDFSVVVVGSRRGDLDDPQRLLESVVRQRREALDAALDVRTAIMTRRLGRLAGLLGRTTGLLGDGTFALPTLVVSNSGIIWPRIVDGRPTRDLAMDSAGALRPIGWLPVMPTPPKASTLLMQTFDGALLLHLQTNATSMTQDEASGAVELIGEKVRDYA